MQLLGFWVKRVQGSGFRCVFWIEGLGFGVWWVVLSHVMSCFGGLGQSPLHAGQLEANTRHPHVGEKGVGRM